jgi:hypothetical protein
MFRVNGRPEVEEVAVPEWRGSVFVRVLTAGERDRFEVGVADHKRANFRARLAVLAICDGGGQRLFREEDVAALAALPAPGLVRVCDVALRINKFREEDVEELEKNSETAPGDDSS